MTNGSGRLYERNADDDADDEDEEKCDETGRGAREREEFEKSGRRT